MAADCIAGARGHLLEVRAWGSKAAARVDCDGEVEMGLSLQLAKLICLGGTILDFEEGYDFWTLLSIFKHTPMDSQLSENHTY